MDRVKGGTFYTAEAQAYGLLNCLGVWVSSGGYIHYSNGCDIASRTAVSGPRPVRSYLKWECVSISLCKQAVVPSVVPPLCRVYRRAPFEHPARPKSSPISPKGPIPRWEDVQDESPQHHMRSTQAAELTMHGAHGV